ncbi:MAG: arsenate reductase ArsC [Sphingomonadaceae bacterium]
MTDPRLRHVLFLCTGNSARSIIAEALMNRLGEGRFRGHSAGSRPVGRVNPHALALLEARGHDLSGLSSKSWDVFAGPKAPAMDLILTVCDSAAGESCPAWPGHPATGHWGLPDPAAARQADAPAAFAATYAALERRIGALIALPPEALDGPGLKAELARIGRL